MINFKFRYARRIAIDYCGFSKSHIPLITTIIKHFQKTMNHPHLFRKEDSLLKVTLFFESVTQSPVTLSMAISE